MGECFNPLQLLLSFGVVSTHLISSDVFIFEELLIAIFTLTNHAPLPLIVPNSLVFYST